MALFTLSISLSIIGQGTKHGRYVPRPRRLQYLASKRAPQAPSASGVVICCATSIIHHDFASRSPFSASDCVRLLFNKRYALTKDTLYFRVVDTRGVNDTSTCRLKCSTPPRAESQTESEAVNPGNRLRGSLSRTTAQNIETIFRFSGADCEFLERPLSAGRYSSQGSLDRSGVSAVHATR